MENALLTSVLILQTNVKLFTAKILLPATTNFQMNAQDKHPYLTFSQIQSELEKRRSNNELKQKVEEFLGDDFPHFLIDTENPVAIISRAIFSPTMEMHYVMDILKSYQLEPKLLEYPGKFVSVNPEKLHLGKLRYFSKTKKGKTSRRVKTIVDFKKYDGRPMSEVETLDGVLLRDYHNRLFLNQFPESQIHEITDWFNKVRKKHGDYYYLGYLSLCIYHGVLFENFLFDIECEKEFYSKKILPSIRKAEEIFGVAPLIHPVIPLKNEADNSWLYYPDKFDHKS